MSKNILFKSFLFLCLFFVGAGCFAQSLNSVEIKSDLNSGKIILGTDIKSAIKKLNISADEIKIELKNTLVADTVKTIYNDINACDGISIMQNGKNAYINISGKNVASYKLLYADDNSLIPVLSSKKHVNLTLLLILSLSALAFALSKLYSGLNICKEKLNKSIVEQTVRQQKIEAEQKRIRELRTLRAKIKNTNNNSIHDNQIPNFVTNPKKEAYKSLQVNNGKLSHLYELRKVANL